MAAEDGRTAQRFLLPDAKGQQHDFYEYKGKPIVLEFMQTACPHCGTFANVLKQVQALVNPPSTPDQVLAFISQNHVNYPILLDQGRVAYAYIRKPAFDIPYIFLIDAGGKIREQFEFSEATQNIFEGNALFPHLDALVSASFGAPAKK